MATWLAVLLIAAALALGLLVGLFARSPTRFLNAINKLPAVLRKFARPAAVVLAGVIVIGALVYAASKTDWSEQFWGQAISAVSLLTITYALYATGERVPTVTRAFSVGNGNNKKDYPVNTALSRDEYAELRDKHGAKIKEQRGLYFRALYTGVDGRWSTSKMQALLWTYAVVYALLAIFIAMQLDTSFDLDLPGDKVAKTFGDVPFHEQYLILLGGYFAAAVLAKGIKVGKVQEGNVSPPVEEQPDPVQGIKDLVSDDSGNGDVGDMQFFLFNLLALTVFFVNLLPHLEKGLPELPTFLVSLTSLSALAYVGKKAVESSKPKIVAIVPSKVRQGDAIRIEGSYFAPSRSARPSVKVDGVAVDASKVEVLESSGTLGEESVVKAEVPEAATFGTEKQVSVRPGGAQEAATATIDIVETKIAARGVEPEPVPWRAGTPFAINGEGFGPDPGSGKRTVKLGNSGIEVTQWTDGRIVGALPSQLDPKEPGEESLLLTVYRDGTSLVAQRTKVALPAIVIDAVEPDPITLRAGATLKISGSGFGPPPGGAAELDDKPLSVGSWVDNQVVATLGEEFPPSAPPSQRLKLAVEREGYASGSFPVQVELPAVTVDDVSPKEIPAKEGTPITIHGSGFGTEGRLTVRLGELSLTPVEGGRSETILQARIESVPESVTRAIAAGTVTTAITVERERWKAGMKEVSLGPG